MPELPDITIYLEALQPRVVGQTLERVRFNSPFLLRTFDPPLSLIEGKVVRRLARVGKRICFGFDEELWLVLHLMIAGRLTWKPTGVKLACKSALAGFDFADGTLLLAEAGSKHRAGVWLLQGDQALAVHAPRGLEVLGCSREAFYEVLRRENHTLKRSLTDPRLFSGIGNAYSDEILHCARLSPLAHSQKLSPAESERLHAATQSVLQKWIERLRAETGNGFPKRVTAFRPEMAVHGRYGLPCPVCQSPVQRIRYAENETNYCPRCQTEGRILADRSLSRLLKDDWPRSLEEFE
jgi:formamidopyrimidine-DNA glycosylase